jgi:hypothetical protein
MVKQQRRIDRIAEHEAAAGRAERTVRAERRHHVHLLGFPVEQRGEQRHDLARHEQNATRLRPADLSGQRVHERGELVGR